ncbi:probable G-protein coupled receptor Mth-like 3 [Strongylocentrotus purpuratus]|uniref:G-protein coupled receptors family 2 profile 2 domain-containing protein n=1 Tax=Strongylocentrotus purpuratus TaxID=7668 RepID=A0A7M7TGB3_STRPU|nr:probable G-protein coupled receptor Mth-like 3 [Strongylocentrotus purpuratus]
MNMTSLDTEYLSAAVNNLIIELSLDVLTFSDVVSMPELSCIPAKAQIDDCDETPYRSICQVCFDTEMNFTALPLSSVEFDQGTLDTLTNITSCLYMPSFGNLSMVELLIDVPAEWSCESHESWTFSDYNKTSVQPFRVNFTREREEYILSVFSIDDICANNYRLVCDTYVSLEASKFEIVTNHSKVSLHISGMDTVLLHDQFQINTDGSAVYCLEEAVSEGRNLPAGLDIMNIVGTVLSIMSVLIVITTYLIFPELRNVAGKSVLTLSITLLLTFLLIFVGGVSTQHDGLCKAVGAITHFFWLSIFFWMNALAIDLNRTFGSHAKFRVGNKSQIVYIWYCLYAWCIPALIVGACLFIDLCDCTNLHLNYGNDWLCWLSSGNVNLFAFGVPLAALLFLNAILFTDTVVGIRLTKKAAEKALKERPALAKAKEELSLYVKLSGVMGFTWILAFVCEYANIPELWYVFIAINSLQGVFILLAFVFNKRIIALWKQKLGVRRDDVTSSTADTKSTSTGNTMIEK